MKMKNLKIGKKFLVIFSLVIAVTLSGAVWQINNLISIGEMASSVYNVRLTSINFLLQADRDAYQTSIAVSQGINYINSAGESVDNSKINGYIEAQKENLGQVGERFGKFKKIFTENGGDAAQEVRQFDSNFDPLKAYSAEIEKLLLEKRTGEALSIYNGKYNEVWGKVRDAMDKLTEISEKSAESEFNGLMTHRRESIIMSLVVLDVTVLVLLLTGIYSTRSFISPIEKILSFAREIEEKNLTVRMPVSREDQFGDVMRSLNAAIESIDSTLLSINQLSDSVNDAIEQINNGNIDLSQRTSEQASSLEEIASTMEESASAMEKNADNSRTARELSERGSSISEEGGRLQKLRLNLSTRSILQAGELLILYR